MIKITVQTSKPYVIEINKGLVVKQLSQAIPEGFVITDSNISRLYPHLVREPSFIIEAGEKSKSFENYRAIIEKLSETNKKVIVALGGGVVGDLAGFVASTYKRGIDLIQIPTSLLAMVDSSIGGKNGINIGNKKNYLGTIYQPEKILIDTLFLETLPENEFKNSVAEIIKYGAVFDQTLLQRTQKKIKLSDIDLEPIIAKCCEIKAKVVEKDEKDKSYRHTLNFGHTIGHALELLYNLSHGEAISIGMLKELELGESEGMVKRDRVEELKKALETNNLPTKFPETWDLDKVLGVMKKDKKGEFVFAFDEQNYNVKLNEEVVKEFLEKQKNAAEKN